MHDFKEKENMEEVDEEKADDTNTPSILRTSSSITRTTQKITYKSSSNMKELTDGSRTKVNDRNCATANPHGDMRDNRQYEKKESQQQVNLREDVLGVSVHHLDAEFKQLSIDAMLNTKQSNRENSKRNCDSLKKKKIFSINMWKNRQNCEKQKVATEEENDRNHKPNIYDVVECVIKNKGRNIICPRDGRLGAAYVDCLVGEDHVGQANVMISYGWGNTVNDICAVLVKYCSENNLDIKRTYVWICCLCNNQFRVDEQDNVPFSEFEQIFEDKVVGIKSVVSLLSPWNAPVYLIS
jgi:hypothetical protein